MGFFRRSVVPAFTDYRRYKPHLRLDFRFQCAYCEQTEAYRRTADAFGADHFRPKRLFPELDCYYPNLYYCCNTCNWSKGTKWPTEDELRHGSGFADPCVSDPYDTHFSLRPDGHLASKSPVGEFTIDHLRLNRPECIRFRVRRRQVRNRIDLCISLLDSLGLPPDDARRNALNEILADLRLEWTECFAATVQGGDES